MTKLKTLATNALLTAIAVSSLVIETAPKDEDLVIGTLTVDVRSR